MAKSIQEFIPEELLKKLTLALENAGIPYMITGALSVIFYGRPRASHDIDLVIEIYPKDFAKIKQAFLALGDDFSCDFTAAREAIRQRRSFNVFHLPSFLKVDFWLLKDNEFDRERFQRRKKLKVFGQKMFFATPEDTVLVKLLWYRKAKIEKHLIDAAFVYQMQRDGLDGRYLLKWARKQGLLKLLGQLAKINLEDYY